MWDFQLYKSKQKHNPDFCLACCTESTNLKQRHCGSQSSIREAVLPSKGTQWYPQNLPCLLQAAQKYPRLSPSIPDAQKHPSPSLLDGEALFTGPTVLNRTGSRYRYRSSGIKITCGLKPLAKSQTARHSSPSFLQIDPNQMLHQK